MDSYLADVNQPLPTTAMERFFSVLRIKPQEMVAVFDGCGREVRGLLAFNKNTKTAVFANATLIEQERLKPAIVLVQAAIEEKSLSETIKRGCEYGVDRFIIFSAEHSEKFCFNKLRAKVDRLDRIARDACRQSGRFFVPTISFKDRLDDIISEERSVMSFGVFGDVGERSLLSNRLRGWQNVGGEFFVVVGPEGGLSDTERTMLKRRGFFGVQWAPFTLRSELAALAAIAIFHAFVGRA